jgi:Ku protein
MARSIWKGAISFGLVNVPVELFPAEDRKEFKFAMLDKRDLTPVGYKRYSKTSGKEVPWDNIVKGYEYEKDQYVVLSDEDFRRANVKATQTIDIRAFVSDDEIPAEYYESPYYLAPAPRGEKVYALLRETLKSAHRVAIAEVVIRTTQHLAAVIPNGRALMLITLRGGFSDHCVVLLEQVKLPLRAVRQGAMDTGVHTFSLRNRSRSTSNDHFSPTTSRAWATGQFWSYPPVMDNKYALRQNFSTNYLLTSRYTLDRYFWSWPSLR